MARPATAHDAPATTHRSSTSPSSAPTYGEDFKTPSSGRLTGHITCVPVVTLPGVLTAIPRPGQSRGRCYRGATQLVLCLVSAYLGTVLWMTQGDALTSAHNRMRQDETRWMLLVPHQPQAGVHDADLELVGRQREEAQQHHARCDADGADQQPW